MKEQSLPQEADLIPPLESHQVSRNGWIESVALLFDLWFTFSKCNILLINLLDHTLKGTLHPSCIRRKDPPLLHSLTRIEGQSVLLPQTPRSLKKWSAVIE